MTPQAALRRAIYKAGLSLEQRGRSRVRCRISAGLIKLRYRGDVVELGDLDDAIEQIQAWGHGVTWRAGAIVKFTKAVNARLAKQPLTDPPSQEFLDELVRLAARTGLEFLGWDPSNMASDEGDPLGFYMDRNDITWCVFATADDRVGYARAREFR